MSLRGAKNERRSADKMIKYHFGEVNPNRKEKEKNEKDLNYINYNNPVIRPCRYGRGFGNTIKNPVLFGKR